MLGGGGALVFCGYLYTRRMPHATDFTSFAADPWPADWLVPKGLPAQVGALMSARSGGVSQGVYASMNLGEFVGDASAAVAGNRERLARYAGVPAVYLKQVHGSVVVQVDARDAWPQAALCHEADACVTTERGLACLIQTADCLPALFAAPNGRAVGAAHAGWRGLASGVLENTLQSVAALAACEPHEVSVWLGACIGPDDFEVGADVLQAFGREIVPGVSAAGFVANERQRWWADLAGLARERLQHAGVIHLSGGCWPTRDSRFFSFRRDAGVTGRMGAAIWIR